jgi:hypothetical protein
MLALVLLAAEALEDEPSKLPFYLLGGLLAVFGVALSAVGISRHATFPPSQAAARGIMALAVVLAVGAMLTAVITA